MSVSLAVCTLLLLVPLASMTFWTYCRLSGSNPLHPLRDTPTAIIPLLPRRVPHPCGLQGRGWRPAHLRHFSAEPRTPTIDLSKRPFNLEIRPFHVKYFTFRYSDATISHVYAEPRRVSPTPPAQLYCFCRSGPSGPRISLIPATRRAHTRPTPQRVRLPLPSVTRPVTSH
jgi:hypothetical protein